MALLTCPECGKEVSDSARQCIHCGYPLGKRSSWKGWLLVLVAALLLGFVLGFLSHRSAGPDISLPFGLRPDMTLQQMDAAMQKAGFVPDFDNSADGRTEYVYAPCSVNGAQATMTLLTVADGGVEVAHLYQDEATSGTKHLGSLFFAFREGLVQLYGLPTHEEMGLCSWEAGAYALRLYYVGETGGSLWLDTVYHPQ